MGHCGTCRHWGNGVKDPFRRRGEHQRCEAIRQREEVLAEARVMAPYTDWDAREAKEAELLAAAKAIAVDGSGYYAAVETLADFGCVLHEPREA